MQRVAVVLFVAGLALPPGVKCQSSADIDSFIPQRMACPEDVQVRPAGNLSSEEETWRETRLTEVISSMKSYLTTANISGFDTESYLSKLNTTNAPILGLAISGGGSTSGMGGLGIWQAFDERYEPAVKAGTGGITQCLTYLTGLSGGGCIAVSTLASNQYTTVDNIRQAVNFSENYVTGPNDNVSEYFTDLYENSLAKQEAGFPVSIADIFGQFWQMYLPESWQNSLFSDLATQNTSFSNGTGPMPILGLAEVIPGQSPSMGNILYPGRNSTNGFNLTEYEVTPFEFGSWLGGRVQGFMPTQYLGSAMSAGEPSGVTCVTGFDRFTFFQGATADAYNFYFISDFFNIPLFAKRALSSIQNLVARQDVGAPDDVDIPSEWDSNLLVGLVNQTAETFGQDFNDTLWAWVPNPFQDYNDAMANVTDLLLVDGSEAGETDPLRPLIIPQRGLDFIIVYEATLDAAYNCDNGTNLINSAQAAEQGGIPFPKVPTVDTLVLRNYTRQPTFFGCNDSAETPLLLWLPNSPWSSYSNYSYTMAAFTDTQLNVTLENAFNLATYGNGNIPAGEGWSTCLACAAVKKSVARVGLELPEVCSQCWTRFCWDGTEEDGKTDTETAFDLPLRLNPNLTYSEWYNTTWSM
ncbi:FabD/lysophospholipase-like protein [Cryphonectria parasitica EP155]|uniref:Lysophospholipase n=1 Tax=Cryphonectria parasitica (strain ATCC 38755 / EP155) TaxID=660469 RepID=A0A9P4XXR1_CRYP1|nr:FabD/lysophospholipase-like protein [Cryphonectria parasitica EP155]KAF3763282.1 FabD/lysophospholipase-like protein [Cryphonectria parasitica EP155]